MVNMQTHKPFQRTQHVHDNIITFGESYLVSGLPLMVVLSAYPCGPSQSYWSPAACGVEEDSCTVGGRGHVDPLPWTPVDDESGCG